MQPSELLESLLTSLAGLATFDIFISPYLLILFYYLGALGGPFLIVMVLRQLRSQRSSIGMAQPESSAWHAAAWARSVNGIRLLGLLAIIGFELLWRIMFEFVLAYFQMRDYLSILASQ